ASEPRRLAQPPSASAAAVTAAAPSGRRSERIVRRARTPKPRPGAAKGAGAARKRERERERSDFFFDSGGLAAEIAQVVELRSTDIATPLHFDLCNRRA